MRATWLSLVALALGLNTGCKLTPHYRTYKTSTSCHICTVPSETRVAEVPPVAFGPATKRYFTPVPTSKQACDNCAAEWYIVEPLTKQVGLMTEPPLLDIERGEVLQAVSRESAGNAVNGLRAADFSWVVGTLEYSHIKKQWRLRYASFDVDDVHGGVLSLAGIEELPEGIKEGGKVWISGQIARTDGRRVSAPEYWVHEMRMSE